MENQFGQYFYKINVITRLKSNELLCGSIVVLYRDKKKKGKQYNKTYNSSSKDITKLWSLVNGTVQYIIYQHWSDFLCTVPPLLTDNKEVWLHNFTKHVLYAGHFPI